MCFKGFIWPHNPETVTVSRVKKIGCYPMPHAGNALRELGAGSREVKGSGAFSGAGCPETYHELAAVFSERGAGQLILPDMDPFPAVFSSLTRKGDPRPNLIRYEFVFLEDGSPPETESVVGGPKIHVCKAGETLFSIAAALGDSVDDLLALNPGIQWPNAPGEETAVAVP